MINTVSQSVQAFIIIRSSNHLNHSIKLKKKYIRNSFIRKLYGLVSVTNKKKILKVKIRCILTFNSQLLTAIGHNIIVDLKDIHK